MKITSVVAAAALATAASTSFAGDISEAGTMDDTIIIITDDTTGSSAGSLGSLGSLGGAAPALLALLVVGAVVAGSGS